MPAVTAKPAEQFLCAMSEENRAEWHSNSNGSPFLLVGQPAIENCAFRLDQRLQPLEASIQIHWFRCHMILLQFEIVR
jgi:hypothetical protein